MSWHITMRRGGLPWLMLLASSGSSAQSSPYDAEEAAYFRQFSNAVVSPTCRSVVENVHDQAKYRAVADDRKLLETQQDLHRQITAIRAVAQHHLARIEIALPPASLRDLHVNRVTLLRHMRTLPEPMAPAQVDDLVSRCRAYYLYNVQVGKTLAARGAVYPRKGTLRLTYEPPLLPLSYNLLDGSFTVKQSISTPLGTLTAGYTNTSGAKLLVIRSQGRERYFTLDQPFEVFVPATHGVMVRSDGGGTIVLEVVSR